ncbi:MAG TPA: argininosuccinate lyase, partial [Pirellulales bacterium]|nr:argininosuccinate lyase [Pirellulales bacterium]
PAYTHLQRAQPVLAAHYWLAYIEKFQRDRERLESLKQRLNVLPLGTGAVAGTSLPIDREMVREQLGFDQIARNSLDASSDRDFVLDFGYALAVIAEHLSGWAEEWIVWSTNEFGYLCLPREFCTCSSMMPQKINPDVLELIRGKTSRVIGNLTSLLMLIKGLPLAYNRDLQEDKPPLFDSFDTVGACLDLAIPMVAQSQWNADNVRAKLEGGYLDATTLMEYMIKLGIPQRTAHHAVGKLVGKAMEQQLPLRELPLQDMQSICAKLDENVYEILGAENALKTFCSLGSTSPDEVAKQVTAWRGRLDGTR